ncbi:MAG: cytochrome c [Gammaproteobacteria bacterium]|nr:cytochrome c [Gammaproteobacteria bacterium]
MKLSALLMFIFLTGCFDSNAQTADSVALGKATFDKNCVTCHGKSAQGLVTNWKTPINGKYPAPPLNGSAHAWHHSPKLLLKTINEGGVKLGGSMPGFKNTLSTDEKQALLDYLYSLWPKNIQQRYDSRFE